MYMKLQLKLEGSNKEENVSQKYGENSQQLTENYGSQEIKITMQEQEFLIMFPQLNLRINEKGKVVMFLYHNDLNMETMKTKS